MGLFDFIKRADVDDEKFENENFFSEENKDLHYDYNQVKRIESAKKLKDEQILEEDLTPEHERALIQGSDPEPYHVTLNACSCVDFAARMKPCKHMYRLALDAGKLDLPTLKKKKASRNVDVQAEIEHYKQLYISGDIDGPTYTKICSALAKIK